MSRKYLDLVDRAVALSASGHSVESAPTRSGANLRGRQSISIPRDFHPESDTIGHPAAIASLLDEMRKLGIGFFAELVIEDPERRLTESEWAFFERYRIEVIQVLLDGARGSL